MYTINIVKKQSEILAFAAKWMELEINIQVINKYHIHLSYVGFK